jgi:hypothetical protein
MLQDKQGRLLHVNNLITIEYSETYGSGGCGARFQKYLPLHQGGWHPTGSLAA